jgi:HNH endonuclease
VFTLCLQKSQPVCARKYACGPGFFASIATRRNSGNTFLSSPIAKHGQSALKNLALACPHCNRRKSDHLFAVDPLDQTEVPLFNPREHRWEEHFIWSSDGEHVVPLTAIGCAAVELLQLNNARRVRIRAEDVKVNRHPPLNDPIQRAN